MNKILKELNIPKNLVVDVLQTGSSVICNPPVLDTDIDFVILTRRKYG